MSGAPVWRSPDRRFSRYPILSWRTRLAGSRIAYHALGYEELVDLGIGEGCITAKIDCPWRLEPPSQVTGWTVSRVDRAQLNQHLWRLRSLQTE